MRGTVSGCDGWKSLKDFGEAKLDWLRKFLPYKDGMPVDDTLARVMRKIETKEFQACFIKWVQSVSKATSGDVVAIDGKTLRRRHNHQDSVPAIHMVSPWSSENGLVLGQEKTAEKSNEITAIPKLLDVLELRGCWAIKPSADSFTSFKKWPDLESLIMIKSRTEFKDALTKDTEDTRFYIASIAPNAEKILTAVRQHWGIQNQLHWTLDMTFREDESRIRTEASPENFDIMRHIALNLIKKGLSQNLWVNN